MSAPYQVFISYRRDGGEDLARLLEDKLTDRGFKVFFDVESLRSGAFNTALLEKIAECTDVLVVLPPHGLDRCTDPKDWVRLEIARALELNKNVIPIMMRNFVFPPSLPEDIDSLRYMNALTANNEYFDAAIEKLVTVFLKSKPLNGSMSDEQLLEEAEKGNVQALNDMGLRFELGSETLIVNQRKAMSFYQRAAEGDEPGALYNLGDIYEQCERELTLVFDYGIEETIQNLSAEEARQKLHQLAEESYARAAAMSFPPAYYRLANLAEEKRDFQKALELYRTASEMGYPPAQNALGYYIKNGIMTEPNQQTAIGLYRQAAEAGFAPAVYNYAHEMELRDIDQAIALYKRVAFGENAIPSAAYSLARLYERSVHDLRSAVSFYRIAFEAGIQEAEKDLRRCQDCLFSNQ